MVELYQLPFRDGPTFNDGRGPQPYFTRRELSEMLSVYSRRVISGEWRDYAIDQRDGRATFSIFRHAQARPLFTIQKSPTPGDRLGEYALFRGPERLAQSTSLSTILVALEGRPRLVEPSPTGI